MSMLHKRSPFSNISLRWIMVVPFVVQIVGVVGLIGYLSYRSGQESVHKLANRLQTEISTRVTERTITYLQTIDQTNKNNISALRRGVWSFDDFSSQERQAWEQMQLSSLSPITIIGFGNPLGGHRAVEILKNGSFVIRAAPNGGGNYMSFTTNADGLIDKGTQTDIYFDSRQRPWYQVAVQARKATWTSIYPHIYTGELLVALAEPVYDLKNGNLLGVTYGLRTLEEISHFLQSIDIRSGAVFIMQRDQTLVATSMLQKPYQLSQNAKEQKLLKASDSQSPIINSATKHLRDRFGDLANIDRLTQFEFLLNNDRQLAQAVPIRDQNGLDWIIVVVLPESDFIAEIQTNKIWTILLCGLTLIVATGISVLTTRWITRSILRFITPSGKIKWVQVNSRPEQQENSNTNYDRQENGDITRYGIVLDISDRKRTELALQQSEERFQTLVQNMPGMVYRFAPSDDGVGTFTYVSSGSFELLELEPERILQDAISMWSLIHPDDLAPLQASVTNAVQNVATWQHEWRMIMPRSGQLKWIQGKSRPQNTPEGMVWDGLFIDISDRKKAKIHLKQALKELNYLIENSPLATIRWDHNFRVEYWSKQAEQIFGWKAEEVIGKNMHDWQFIFEADLDHVNQVAAQLLSGEGTTCQNRNYHADGSIVYCEWYNSALLDELGSLVSMLSLAHDITDRKHLEQELVENRDFRELIFNESSDALFLVDTDTLLTMDCNQQAVELFEVSSKTGLINIEGHILQKRQFTLEELATIQREINQKGYWRLEVEYITCRGREFWGDLSVKQIAFGEKRFNLVRVVDISDRKQTEIALAKAKAAAEDATRAKSAFLASMSHEIRTPMNGVIGMTQILETTSLTKEQEDFVQTIKDSGEALLSIINDILDFSKIESGMLEIESNDFDLEEVIHAVCKLLESQAIAKKIQIQYTFEPDIPSTFIGDRHRLRQILLNLVGNAIKFTQHGQVSISVSGKFIESNQYQLKFAIADTGIGIRGDRIDKLFQPFTQADASISRQYGGTGLGLAISKRLVDLMGGTIWVKSLGQVGGNPDLEWQSEPDMQAASQGSVFYFTIVVTSNPNSKLNQRTSVKHFLFDYTLAEKFPLRILLVEDNKVNQMVARLLLKKLGYQIDIAENGLEAVKVVQENSYDLILMDVQMPEMDGLTATKLIRLKLMNQVRIVAMTADAMPEDRQACIEAGMDDYISKPINIQEIVRLVSSTK